MFSSLCLLAILACVFALHPIMNNENQYYDDFGLQDTYTLGLDRGFELQGGLLPCCGVVVAHGLIVLRYPLIVWVSFVIRVLFMDSISSRGKWLRNENGGNQMSTPNVRHGMRKDKSKDWGFL